MSSLDVYFSLLTNIFLSSFSALSSSSGMNLLLISVNATWQSSWIDLEPNSWVAATFPLPAYSPRALLRPGASAFSSKTRERNHSLKESCPDPWISHHFVQRKLMASGFQHFYVFGRCQNSISPRIFRHLSRCRLTLYSINSACGERAKRKLRLCHDSIIVNLGRFYIFNNHFGRTPGQRRRMWHSLHFRVLRIRQSQTPSALLSSLPWCGLLSL